MSRVLSVAVASVFALGLGLGLGSLGGIVACSGSSSPTGFDDPSSSNDASTSQATGSSGGFGGGGADGGSSGAACVPNSANYDVPGNNCDDDGDGTVDNPPTCDGSLGGTAEDFAKALGICTKASEAGYGLVSATFTRGHGVTQAPQQQQHGLLPKFGDVLVPREGKMLGVLSTGYAQEYDGAPGVPFGGEDFDNGSNGQDWGFNGTLPSGFPKAAKGCEQDRNVFDTIAVVLELKAPANAAGIKFDFNFLSGEWPAYICSEFNDGFIAYLEAAGFNGGTADNMSFDKDGNPVSVNNGFFDRCTPNVDTGCAPYAKPGTSVCSGGASELAGTGFGIVDRWCSAYGTGNAKSTSGGGTGWLTSAAPVKAGETFKLEFIIWDTGDGVLDSSVLLDNFTWAAGEVQAGTDRPK